MPLFTRRRATSGPLPDLHGDYLPPDGLRREPGDAPPGTAAETASRDADVGASSSEPAEVRLVGVAPKVVSPAWELEMLISGVLTFALLQGPNALHDVYERVGREATAATFAVLVFARMYLGAILWALIVAFVLNLVTRAYWVGLVGLNSVYPHGARWERYRAGPFMRDEYRARLSSLPRLIERVDNFASLLFSFGFLIVLLFLVSAGIFAVVYGLGWAAARVLNGGRDLGDIPLLIFLALVAPQLLFTAADRFLGPRLRPGGRPARAMRVLARATYLTNGSAIFGPIFTTMYTNAGRAFSPVLFGALALTLALGLGEMLARSGAFEGRGLTYIPKDDDLLGRHSAHYESLREPDLARASTMIQSDIVTDPYLRLFVPYAASEADARIPHACPDAPRLRGADAPRARPGADSVGAARVLACLGRVHAVALDGRPLTGLRWRFTTHRDGGRAGIVAYISLEGAAPGEHELAVAQMPARRRGRWVTDTTRIPFWR